MKTRVSPLEVVTDWAVLAAALAGLSLFGLAVWAVYGRDRDDAGRDGADPENGFTHVHCPACRNEQPYQSELVGTECEQCSAGVLLQATRGSIHESEVARWAGFACVLVPTGLALLGGFGQVVAVRTRALRARRERLANRMVVAWCPVCEQRLRYPVSRCGEGTVCSRCKTAFLLPVVGTAASN